MYASKKIITFNECIFSKHCKLHIVFAHFKEGSNKFTLGVELKKCMFYH